MTHARHGAKQTETVSNVMTAMETHSSMVKPSMVNANFTMEKKNKQSHHSNMMSIVNVIQIRWSVLNAMSLFTWIQKGNANQPQQDAKLSKMKLVLSVSKDIHLTPKENAWYCLPIAQRWMRMEPALNANRDSSWPQMEIVFNNHKIVQTSVQMACALTVIRVITLMSKLTAICFQLTVMPPMPKEPVLNVKKVISLMLKIIVKSCLRTASSLTKMVFALNVLTVFTWIQTNNAQSYQKNA